MVSTFSFGLAFGVGVINRIGAFIPTSSSSPYINRPATSTSALSARNGRNLSKDANGVAAASIVAFGLFFPVNNAVAAETYQLEHSIHSSNVLMSATIRTMDFALPSSYDNIATTTVEKDELSNEVNTIGQSAKSKSVKKSPENVKSKEKTRGKLKSKESGLEISVLSPSERKAASKQALAERKAAREEAELQKKEDELRKAQEIQENIKAAREAKIAAREAQQAEEAAAAASKAE